MNTHKSKTVLITGASSGIGYELSKIFAENGYNLVIVARNIERLNNLAKEIIERFNVKVKTIQKNLALIGAAEEIFEEVESSNIDIDILVNNAGAGANGLFHEIDLKRDIEMINLNIAALTVLTKLFSRKMIERKEGKILNIASTGSYQPGPYIAVYYATKAYVLSFSEAITNELKDYGINVTTVCPGATKTEFSRRAGKADLGIAMDAKIVAQVAYDGLKKNKKLIIPGAKNKAAVFISKLLPGNISAKVVRKVQQGLTESFKGN
ncbi:SDR family NAD(P)-dependent oxidoreductase [Clostridium thermopalmarium]|uniref:Putative ketoacyl reductase n=2 Tax=Clostridium TaxID=1485 RepID=A0A151AN52_9CLOT|nr:putative ketoacyl reductase [Clostridium colicanis DSM 13634]PRR73264.1 putative ketoacyl reductase [Clostridium thermopalmarium DSM 5974]PVZ25173.1 hypothetical protein LX19_01046 [Clostridium thermopalmarium DSM 5974]